MSQYEYTVRPSKPNTYVVYKFETGNDMPETEYTVTTYDSQYKCNCPAGKWHKHCGHMTMVKEYRKLERSWVKDPEQPMAMITFKK